MRAAAHSLIVGDGRDGARDLCVVRPTANLMTLEPGAEEGASVAYLGRVAVIMRTKDRPQLIERAFNSVLDQTFEDWHLVVVNDGGDAHHVDKLVRKYGGSFGNRVSAIHNEASVGRAAASNLGLAHGESEFVVIHDDDDTWAPNFLLMSVNELERVSAKLPSVRGAITHTLLVEERMEEDSAITERMRDYNRWLPAGILSFFRVAEANAFPPISFVYRREALEKTGRYDESLPALSDWDFNLRFMSHFDIIVIPHALAFWHQRTGSCGALSNACIGDNETTQMYEQYVRNKLLRQDVAGNTSGLGALVSYAQQFDWTLKRLDHITVQAHSVVHAQMPPAIAAHDRKRAPLFFLASAAAFLSSEGKMALAHKFVDHWRRESPRRALAVVARYGYLAMGGK